MISLTLFLLLLLKLELPVDAATSEFCSGIGVGVSNDANDDKADTELLDLNASSMGILAEADVPVAVNDIGGGPPRPDRETVLVVGDFVAAVVVAAVVTVSLSSSLSSSEDATEEDVDVFCFLRLRLGP
jgi:hypothetical protein